MENNSNSNQVESRTIYLGEIPVIVYQTDDGNYYLDIESVTGAIDE